MDFSRRLALGDRWTNFQHMGAEDPAAISQIVGVVLHERRSALETVTHDLHGPHKRRRFPVAFRAESISIGHQTLHGNSWKLRQAVQVLKRVGECLGADRKSTRLNSSHSQISYAVFCLKKKKKKQ